MPFDLTYDTPCPSFAQTAGLVYFVVIFLRGRGSTPIGHRTKKRLEEAATYSSQRRGPLHERSARLMNISGVETTGHDWDGVSELDNPLAALVAVAVLGLRDLEHRLLGHDAGSWPLVQFLHDRHSRSFGPRKCRC